MGITSSHKINKLIDQFFAYNENYKLIVDEIINIGKPAIPELLTAIREREFRHSQSAIDTKWSAFKHIANALVGIVENEKKQIVKNRINLQIINEMAVHVKWQIKIPISSREDFEHYKKAFDDNLFNKACESALTLGRLRDSRALPHLFEVIKNEYSHTSIKENAIIALGEIGNEKSIPHLIELITHHDFNTHFAIDALAKIGSTAAVPPLLDCLENVSGLDIDDTQASIIWALGQLRDPRATHKLIEWIKIYKDDMRGVAIQALGNIGDPSAIHILETCLGDVTVLNRQDMGGTFWLFRKYRGKKICDMALESLRQIGTQEALNVIETSQSSNGT